MHHIIAATAVLVLAISVPVFAENRGKLVKSTQPDDAKSTIKKKDPQMFSAMDGFVTQACNWYTPEQTQQQADHIQDNMKVKYPLYLWNTFVFNIKAKWDFAVFTHATYKGTCGDNQYFVFGVLKATAG